MGFHNARIGYAGAAHHVRSNILTKRATCEQGGLYISPTKGQTLDAAQPVQISWDTTMGCLGSDPQQVDIYVNAPSISDTYLTALRLNYNRGTYNTTISPGFWNNTASVVLQLNIVPAGSPPFLTNLAPGPMFTLTHDTSLPPAPINTGGFNQVIDGLGQKHISKGGAAAAVLLPLLALAAAAGIFFKWSRAKQAAKSKRWSQAVDKRMSTISTDWKSMTGAGANAAIRSSMANRASSIFGSTGRPSSTLALEGGHAGVGAGVGTGVGVGPRFPNPQSEMAQLRQARASAFGLDRTSRISFAENVRMSTGDLRPIQTDGTTAATRTYHPRSFDEPRNDDGVVSPTQAQGPQPLTADDIRAKVAHTRDDIDGDLLQMPAMTLMRAGQANSSTDDLILPPSPPSPPSAAPLAPPSPAYPKSPLSPMGLMPMGPSPAALSPDEMLRAYADSRRAPSTNSNNSGMRTLYSPSPVSTPTGSVNDPFGPSAVVGTRPRGNTVGDNNPYRKSMKSISIYSANDEDPYGGVEEVGSAQ